MIARLIADALALGALACRPQLATSAENLVLRRQLALFKERGITPRRIDAAARISLAVLSRMCDWRSCMTLVRPQPHNRVFAEDRASEPDEIIAEYSVSNPVNDERLGGN